jgi:hypothetical protein
MQYLLLVNDNSGSALAPQCNVAGTSAVVTADSDLSKADYASGTLTASEICLFLFRFT